MEKEFITSRLYFDAVMPALPLIFDYFDYLAEPFKEISFSINLQIINPEFSMQSSYVVNNGSWKYVYGECQEDADLSFIFSSAAQFNSNIYKYRLSLPKIKGRGKGTLSKDISKVLKKLRKVLYATAPLSSERDRLCQSAMIIKIFPSAINVLCRENLSEIVNALGNSVHFVIHPIVTCHCAVDDVVIEYHPDNMPQSQPIYKDMLYDDCQEITSALLLGEFSNNVIQRNDETAFTMLQFFAERIKHYCRLEYR